MILFGKLKPTALIEKERIQLRNDYRVYGSVENSDKLKEYLSLKGKVESTSFIEKKKEIEILRFKGSPEDTILKKFQRLDKNPKIQKYFQTLASDERKRFEELLQEKLPERFHKLEHYVKSGDYKRDRNAFLKAQKSGNKPSGKWEETHHYLKYTDFSNLKQSADWLFYTRFTKSANYRNFRKMEGSSKLIQYEDLKKEVSSEKFAERKAYLEDALRYEKTDDFQLLQRYKELNNDPEIQLYLKYYNTDAFRFFRKWEPTFTDEFDAPIDNTAWSFITPLALKGPGKNFSVKGQLQYYNQSDNIQVDNSILTLQTQAEKVEGLCWDENYGFVVQNFDYASGVMHTLDSFRQEYGHFEVKVKASKVSGVLTSVSLVDEEEEYAIRIFSKEGGKLWGGLVYTDQDRKIVQPVRFPASTNGFVIVQVNWTPERISWKMNDRDL
nr:family 16 glycosylhydrolase [Prolixibacteraceae bacterium]